MASLTSFDYSHEQFAPESLVTIVSKDGHSFTTTRRIFLCSSLLHNICIDLDPYCIENETFEVPLPTLLGVVLGAIIEYLEFHHARESSSAYSKRSMLQMSLLKGWNSHFCEKHSNLVYEFIIAADYLNIRPLYELALSYVARLIENKSADEIRKLLTHG